MVLLVNTIATLVKCKGYHRHHFSVPKRLNATMKHDQTLDQYLQSLSEALIPVGEPGPVTIRSRNGDGDTPLHIAAFAGNRHVVRLLLEAGADIHAKGDLSTSPLYNAVSARHVQVSELLLQYGADPDAENELGYTPRTLAKQDGDKAMIALFKRYRESSKRR